MVSRAGARDGPRAGRTGFWLFASHLYALFGIAISNALLGLTLLSLPWTARRGGGEGWRRARPLLIAFGLYFLFLILSVAFSHEPATSFPGAGEVFNLAALVAGVLLVRSERDVRWIVDGLVILGGAAAVHGLFQYLTGFGGIDQRIRGPFSHYMTFAGFLMLCDLLLLSSMLFRQGWRDAWRWLALAAINVALLGSLTRSAWVGFAIAVTFLVILRAPRLLLAYVPIAVLLVALAPTTTLDRIVSITDLRDRSNYDRLCMAKAGLRMIAERPLYGQGPKLVEQRYGIYRPSTAPRYQVPHLHNSFLQLGAERGLPALAAYLTMMVLAILACWRRYRDEGGKRGPRADLFAGALVALFAFNVAGIFEDNWGDTEIQRVVFFLLILPFILPARTDQGEGGSESVELAAGEGALPVA